MLETLFVGIEGKGKWECRYYLPFLARHFLAIVDSNVLGWRGLRINSNSPVQVEHEQSEVAVPWFPTLMYYRHVFIVFVPSEFGHRL